MNVVSASFLSAACLVAASVSAAAQSFNVDLQPPGSTFGVPSSAYGAGANQPGVWNAVETFSGTSLVDLSGASTSVTFANTSRFDSWFSMDHPDVSGDDAALMEDVQCISGGEGGTWRFTGLEPGDYEVLTYGWIPDNPGGFTSAQVSFAAEGLQFSNAAWPGGQVEGLTFVRHRINVGTFGQVSINVSGNPFGLGASVNGFQLVKLEHHTSYCFGPATTMPGCTDCPCGNVNITTTPGGCANSTALGSILYASGNPSISNDTLRMEVRDMVPSTSGTLFSGINQLPANPVNPCFGMATGIPNAGDGLRCMGGGLLRHGARGSNSSGDIGVTGPGWGGDDNPMEGLAAHAGAAAGQTRHYQVIHRDDAMQVCGSGINSTQGVSVTFQP